MENEFYPLTCEQCGDQGETVNDHCIFGTSYVLCDECYNKLARDPDFGFSEVRKGNRLDIYA